jgi:hypothetical protein
MTRMWSRYLAACLLITIVASPTVGHAEPGDDLTVYVLTFGPGEHPFLKFGHDAILVQPTNAPGWVFNFGTFDFQDPALLSKFLHGRFHYWLSVGGAQATLEAYAAENRTILAQELDLSPAERWRLWQSLRENAKPENRAYLYDYFYDNCATRVRDAIDKVTGGRVRAAGRTPVKQTMRDDALRSTADFLPEYLGLYLGLSRATDAPIHLWEASFLPERLAELLRHTSMPGGDGGDRPLVKAERIVYQSTRPAKPEKPPQWAAYFLAVGVALGALLAGLGRAAKRKRAARAVLGGLSATLGLLFGLLGIALLGFWAFTNHRVAYANANILQLAPWVLSLLVLGVGVALGWPRSTRAATWVALLALVSSVVGVLCKLTPGLNQDNWPFVLFFLPVWLGLWLGLRALGGARGEAARPVAK